MALAHPPPLVGAGIARPTDGRSFERPTGGGSHGPGRISNAPLPASPVGRRDPLLYPPPQGRRRRVGAIPAYTQEQMALKVERNAAPCCSANRRSFIPVPAWALAVIANKSPCYWQENSLLSQQKASRRPIVSPQSERGWVRGVGRNPVEFQKVVIFRLPEVFRSAILILRNQRCSFESAEMGVKKMEARLQPYCTQCIR
jgi:hypothetical protein